METIPLLQTYGHWNFWTDVSLEESDVKNECSFQGEKMHVYTYTKLGNLELNTEAHGSWGISLHILIDKSRH